MAKKPADFKPKIQFPKNHHWAGARRCQGWRPKLSRQCKKLARKGRRTCRTCGSGGRPPTSGRYTKLAQLQTRVEQALGDGALLDLRAEIAILSTRADDLLGSLQDAESRPDLGEIRNATLAIQSALRFGDSTKAGRATDHLLNLLDQSAAESETWEEIRATFLAMDRIVKSAAARELETKALVPWVQVLELVVVFKQLLYRYIPEHTMRLAFVKEFHTKFGRVADSEPAQLEAPK